MKRLFNRILLVPLLVFALSLTLFVSTLNPSILPGDSGEFITVIGIGGVAHPPGYPLFTLIGKLFSYLPFGSLPEKINLLSAIFGAGTIAILAYCVSLLTKSRLAAAISSGVLAVSSSFWLYSTAAEVFTLHTFLISLFLWQSILFIKNPSSTRALFLTFILALNASNHHTAALLLPALVYLIVRERQKIDLNLIFLIKVLVVSLAGIAPYLYILIVAAPSHPAINWDQADNLNNLMRLFLRYDYGTGTLAPNNLSFTPKTGAIDVYFSSLWKETKLILPILAAVGANNLWRQKNKLMLIILGSGFLALGPVFLLISRVQIASVNQKAALERFFIAPNLFLAVMAGIGLAFIFKQKYIGKIAYAVILSTLTTSFILNFSSTNQKNNYFYENYSRKLLENMPPNSALITTGDTSDFGTNYLQLIKNERTDIKIITLPKTTAGWYREGLIRRYEELKLFITENPSETLNKLCEQFGREGLLFISGVPPGLELKNDSCTPMPDGLLTRLLPSDFSFEQNEYVTKQKITAEIISKELLLSKRPKDLRTERVVYEISASFDAIGNFLYQRNNDEDAAYFWQKAVNTSPFWFKSLDSLAALAAKNGSLEEAIIKEKEAIRRNSDHLWSYYNLGILLLETKDYRAAENALLSFLSFKPDKSHPEVNMAKKALQELKNSIQ